MSGRAGLLAHLAGGAATVARAWWVARRDGVGFGFTDHDGDLEFAGRRFTASSGLSAKALQQTTGLSVDNTEAMGALSDAAIDEGDLAAGRFDGAEVTIWAFNWANPDQHMVQFKGHFGEVTRAGGAFKVDLRGQTEVLNRAQGRVYQRGCSAGLGDGDCLFDLTQAGFRADLVVASLGADGQIALQGSALQAARFFQLGRAVMLTGQAAGLTAMVKQDDVVAGGRSVTLWQGFALPIAVGDTLRLEAGCDRSAATCKSKFANLANFQGFPHIPGEDWQISYPDSLQPKDGGSLFR